MATLGQLLGASQATKFNTTHRAIDIPTYSSLANLSDTLVHNGAYVSGFFTYDPKDPYSLGDTLKSFSLTHPDIQSSELQLIDIATQTRKRDIIDCSSSTALKSSGNFLSTYASHLCSPISGAVAGLGAGAGLIVQHWRCSDASNGYPTGCTLVITIAGGATTATTANVAQSFCVQALQQLSTSCPSGGVDEDADTSLEVSTYFTQLTETCDTLNAGTRVCITTTA